MRKLLSNFKIYLLFLQTRSVNDRVFGVWNNLGTQLAPEFTDKN